MHKTSERGVTLIELMISTALISVVIASAVTGFLAQTRIQRGAREIQETQDAVRTSVATIERFASRTGYGMGPEFAIDMNWYQCAGAYSIGDCATAPSVNRRDSTTTSDELVVYSRNPYYRAGAQFSDPLADPPETNGHAWEILSASSGAIELRMHPDDVMHQGRIILAICNGGFTYAYVTSNMNNVVTGLPAGTSVPVMVNLQGEVGGDPFRQNSQLSESCFSAGQARAFAIDRFRFFVADPPANAAGDVGPPVLWLDRGMDLNLDGNIDDADLQPVAEGVEDLQVAYVARNGAIHGDSAGDPDFSANPPFNCSVEVEGALYQNWALAPCGLSRFDRARWLPHFGNTVELRVSITARTRAERLSPDGVPRTDPNHVPSAFSMENHDRTADPDDGFRRVRATTVISMPNMDGRGIPLL